MSRELDTVRQLQQELRANLAFVVNHSGGKDSTRILGFSCRVCIFSTDADLRAIHQHNTEAFDLVRNLETKIGFTMRPGPSLVQIMEASVSTSAETARQQSFKFCP